MSDVQVNENDITLLVISFLALAVTIGLLVFNIIFLSSQAHRADLVFQGVCQFRQNLQQQVLDSEHYLVVHPNGAPALGLSAASIQQSIDREKLTVDSLAPLNCPTR